jgi:hypothetical protein
MFAAALLSVTRARTHIDSRGSSICLGFRLDIDASPVVDAAAEPAVSCTAAGSSSGPPELCMRRLREREEDACDRECDSATSSCDCASTSAPAAAPAACSWNASAGRARGVRHLRIHLPASSIPRPVSAVGGALGGGRGRLALALKGPNPRARAISGRRRSLASPGVVRTYVSSAPFRRFEFSGRQVGTSRAALCGNNDKPWN